ncbi:unnamed protein product [Rhizoctonia solani]|uniref:Uncharacterized protein n=1 Tax=Rhizoctonia solani TaxID=456999 RepID=A0A8H3HSU6_9AGAM|nr:unnamed protein product [Rhizoctonia solani]CAE6540671.1 unnamed protein product [Rhizoctonia solani]
MPKPKSPFDLLPSAPPPGSSYFISNAVIIAKRVALGLEAPIRINNCHRKYDNPFYDWYRRDSSAQLVCMQLRKEQKAPFFHEYVAFALRDGRYFRIDRRQLPNEASPMDCTSKKGVKAYDTIEEITSLDDSMYNPSDCLAEVYFPRDTRLSLIICICTAISRDSQASAYTVQRYNCYFYAQTILLYTACKSAVRTRFGGLWEYSYQYDPPVYAGPPTQASYFSIQWPWKQASQDENGGHQPREMQTANWYELKAYLLAMIHAHSLRVEQYKFVLRCSAEEVERDIKEKMSQIW